MTSSIALSTRASDAPGVAELSHPTPEALPAPRDEAGRIFGYIHSFESGAGVDGPGMRFAVFTQGCQLRCWYCHNPDTWKVKHGRLMSVDQVLDEIRPYAGFLRRAGGLTITGGEPLLQAEFVGELAHRAKTELRLHVALDTQGFLGAVVSDAWLDNIDLVLLDIKSINPERYQALTAQPLAPTLTFARRLSALGKPMWIRYVLVPGITDDPDEIGQLADFLAELKGIERVEVLPFHKMGEHKWEELGMPYRLHDTPAASPVLAEMARGIFRNRGLECC